MLPALAAVALTAGLATLGAAYEGDVPGSQDHPYFHRWPAAYIAYYDQKDAVSYDLPLGALKEEGGAEVIASGQTVVGRVTRILYRISDTTVAAAQVYFSYEGELKRTGIQKLAEAKAATVRGMAGAAWVRKVYGALGDDVVSQLVTSSAPNQRRYLSGKLTGKGGDVYIVVLINQLAPEELRIMVDIIETTPA